MLFSGKKFFFCKIKKKEKKEEAGKRSPRDFFCGKLPRKSQTGEGRGPAVQASSYHHHTHTRRAGDENVRFRCCRFPHPPLLLRHSSSPPTAPPAAPVGSMLPRRRRRPRCPGAPGARRLHPLQGNTLTLTLVASCFLPHSRIHGFCFGSSISLSSFVASILVSSDA